MLAVGLFLQFCILTRSHPPKTPMAPAPSDATPNGSTNSPPDLISRPRAMKRIPQCESRAMRRVSLPLLRRRSASPRRSRIGAPENLAAREFACAARHTPRCRHAEISSTSTISRFFMQQKSTMYPSMEYWRRKRAPSRFFSLRCDQSRTSAGVGSLRSWRDRLRRVPCINPLEKRLRMRVCMARNLSVKGS